MEKIILIGAGKHCRVVLYNMQMQNLYEAACILDNSGANHKTFEGVEVVSYDQLSIDLLNSLRKTYKTNKFFIAFGNMDYRKQNYEFFVENGWESVNIVHPHAVVSKDAILGKGILIECGALVTPNPKVGNNVVINTGSQVNHDNIIHDHVYMASGIVLSGSVEIGENTLLDDGVIVSIDRKVGANSIIGAGSIVSKSIPDNVIAYGCPCKVVRENK